MQSVFGDDTPSKMTIGRWMEKFEDGCDDINDAPRSGRPLTTTTAQNIIRVQTAIDSDRRMTTRELENMLSLPHSSIHDILKNHLGMSRVSARWVPKVLTEDQKRRRFQVCKQLLERLQEEPGFLDRIVTVDESWFHYYEPESKAASMQWKRRDEPTPIKARSVPSAGKRMATIFWDKKGILLIKWLPEKQTINSDYYVNLLTELREIIKKERRGLVTRGIILQQDNARPHTSRQTVSKIGELGYELLPHPAYSPDLAPCDYWLFGQMKKFLGGKHFQSIQGLSSAVSQWVNQTDVGFFAEGIQKLPERWQKCVSVKGEWFEKMDTD